MSAQRRHPGLGFLLGACWLSGCQQEEPIARALPPSASNISVQRQDVEGSLEGDATVTVTARFPDAAACAAFIASYRPREQLVQVGAAWSHENPGRESRSLRCDGETMVYTRMLL